MTKLWDRRLAAAFLVLALVMAGACGTEDDDDDTGATTADPESHAGDPEHFQASIDFAKADVDAFWREAFAQLNSGVAYESPSTAYGYHGAAGELPDTACGGSANNAQYCPLDKSITWDIDFLQQLHDEQGDMAPMAVIAHEWGHHIQFLAGEPRFAIQRELQADCYAGVYSARAAAQGQMHIGEFEESVRLFYGLAAEFDEAEWFNMSEHGSSQDRAVAYSSGYYSTGPASCLKWEDYHQEHVLELGDGLAVPLSPSTQVQDLGEGAYRLNDPLGSADVQVQEGFGAEPASTYLPAVQEGWFGDSVVSLIGEPIQYSDTNAAVQYYEQQHPEIGTVHGAISLWLNPENTGKGVVIDSYVKGPAPDSIEGFAPVDNYLTTLISGLPLF